MYLALAGPSGIRARWGIKINGRFEAEMPLTLAGPPSGGRAATLTPLFVLYSTRSLSYKLADLGPRPARFIRPTLH